MNLVEKLPRKLRRDGLGSFERLGPGEGGESAVEDLTPDAPGRDEIAACDGGDLRVGRNGKAVARKKVSEGGKNGAGGVRDGLGAKT